MYSYGPPHMADQKQDDQHEHTFSSYVRIRDVALKTNQRRWTIGRIGERGSGISVLVAQHDDDDDTYHDHHIMPPARISLIFTRHPGLSSITLRRSSRIYPLSAQSCCVYIVAGRPLLVQVKGPQEYVTYEFVLTSPAESRMSGSCNLDGFRDGC